MNSHDHEATRRRFPRLMVWMVVPTVAYMGYLIFTDGELYMPTRRP